MLKPDYSLGFLFFFGFFPPLLHSLSFPLDHTARPRADYRQDWDTSVAVEVLTPFIIPQPFLLLYFPLAL